jgi:translation initiation factor 3 subunit E
MADSVEAGSNDVAVSYDLIPKLMPHLDRHLVFPLLEFVQQRGIFTDEEITQAKYDLMKGSDMVDFVSSLYTKIHNTDDPPEELIGKREVVLQRLKDLGEQSEKVMQLLEDPDVVGNLRSDKMQNMQYLKDNHGV